MLSCRVMLRAPEACGDLQGDSKDTLTHTNLLRQGQHVGWCWAHSGGAPASCWAWMLSRCLAPSFYSTASFLGKQKVSVKVPKSAVLLSVLMWELEGGRLVHGTQVNLHGVGTWAQEQPKSRVGPM